MDAPPTATPTAPPIENVGTLLTQLVGGCRDAGLDAEIVAPTRVRVSSPGADARLTETIRCMPDRQERLCWWWSWNEPIGPAAHIADAVRIIAYVVTPAVPEA